MSFLRDQDDRAVGILGVTRDITERKKMEQEILKFSKLESVGILAGGIAHDFNNFLMAILGNISVAKMYTEPGDKISERLTEAEKASLRARDLTKQLLIFSLGGAPIKKILSIAEVIKDSALFALRGSKARCEFSIPADLWPVEVDEGQIGQAINNLVINADQALPEGGIIEVRAENITIDANYGFPVKEGEYIKISIKDQGVGIPEEYLTKIFDPYFTTKQKGSGLGLATTYSIIKNHQGYITLESKTREGTTFYVYLPALPKEFLTEKDEEEKIFAGSGKILVVDDEKMVRDVTGNMLKLIGYESESAGNGVEAVEVYKKARESQQSFDAIILDLTIPGTMGGRETIKKLMEIDPEVKAIVCSGYSNDPVMANFREYGFSGFLVKPYKVEELNEILQRIITDKNE
jgi:nitrogen-specific signal transduction histidine kinase/CheY-like chemotaxis protein